MTSGRLLPRLSAAAVLAAGLLALPVAGSSAPQGAATILPGYWEYRVKMAGLTVDNEKWCVREDQIDKFFTGPCNRHHRCVYPTRQVGNGKARFVGYWQNDEGRRASVDAAGEYSDKRFVLRTKATKGTNGAPIPPLTLDARWLSATCQPGAKTPR